jgi:hypothetical protein
MYFLVIAICTRGFKCLDVATGRIYISRDVTFDEEVFPFSKLHPNARVRLWSEIQILPSLFPPRLDSSGNGCVVEPCAHATPANEVSRDFFDTRGAQDDYSSDGTNSRDNPHVDSTLGSHPWQIYMVWLPRPLWLLHPSPCCCRWNLVLRLNSVLRRSQRSTCSALCLWSQCRGDI